MPATIGASPDSVTIRMNIRDHFGEDANKIFMVDGALTDDALEALLDGIEATTNVAFDKVSVSSSRLATGLRATPINQLFNLAATFLVLTFERVNPVNAAKTLRKSFILPAPKSLVVSSDGSPNVGVVNATPTTANDYLANLIDQLEDSLAFEGSDGSIYAGGWTYVPSRSSLATGSAVIDGV